MDEVKVFIPINSVPVTERNQSTVLMVNFPMVKASDYDQLKDENWQLKEEAKWATEVTGELVKERDTLRKQLDEANAALGSKNARIAEFAERHLSDFAELERLGKQLDEARELLEEVRTLECRGVDMAHLDAWLEACSTQR